MEKQTDTQKELENALEKLGSAEAKLSIIKDWVKMVYDGELFHDACIGAIAAMFNDNSQKTTQGRKPK